MRGFTSRLFALAGAYVPEALFVVAAGLVCFGISLIFLPAAFIVGGLLIAAAVIDGRR